MVAQDSPLQTKLSSFELQVFSLLCLLLLPQDTGGSPPAIADSPVPPPHPHGVVGLLAWHTHLHLVTSFTVNMSRLPTSDSLRKPAPWGHGPLSLSPILTLELYPYCFPLAGPIGGV